mmetsp:Transcript_19259/g.45582  ORF Transcript_19259/g.45582 Transcript_19259/m.45582 type:complete len:249 (-) Transcript_19259:147-893(-)
MLGGGDGEARGLLGVVILLGAQQRRHGVGAQKVHQVPGPTHCRALHRGHPTETEVVELEAGAVGDSPLGVAGLLQGLVDGQLLVAAVGRHGHRVPHLDQQRLQEVGKPEALWICVHHGEERRLHRHHHALRQGLDGDRQAASVLFQDVLEALFVEKTIALEVLRAKLGGLVDLGARDDLAREVALDEVLQAEEHDLVPLLALTAAALKVAVDVLSSLGILLPMAELVAVRGQDQIVCPSHAGGGHRSR